MFLTPEIFISYRHLLSKAQAQRIHAKLAQAFHPDDVHVFLDTHDLQPGENYREGLRRHAERCDVMLVLISPGWETIERQPGQRRLDQPNDPVRREIETALARRIPLVPVLLDGVAMPEADSLSQEARAFSSRQGIRITLDESSLDELVAAVRPLLPSIWKQCRSRWLGRWEGLRHPTSAGFDDDRQPSLAAKGALFIPTQAPLPGTETQDTKMFEPEPAALGLPPARPLGGGRVWGAALVTLVLTVLVSLAWLMGVGGSAAGDALPVAASSPVHAPTSGVALQDGEEPRPQPRVALERFRDCEQDSCPWLIALPDGPFEMGSPTHEKGRSQDEGPAHTVSIRSVAVGQFEVTFAQWDACDRCRKRPSDEGWGRGNRPVINISRDDALTYARWLSARTGKPYRLLSEAEWEYAARAGTRTAYFFGDAHESRWVKARAASGASNPLETVARQERTDPVGTWPANAWNLHDLHGNVWEWVADCYHRSYDGAPADGTPWLVGCVPGTAVARGGGVGSEPRFLRAAQRLRERSQLIGYFGFRVARELP